jgi:HSP20 family molecular chaperone IbpA
MSESKNHSMFLNVGDGFNISMKCPKCGKELEKAYRFCPFCGARTARRRSIFDLFFPRFGKEMSLMEKQMRQMERQFEALDIRPLFRQPGRGRGFTIKIVRRGGEEPKVSVQTFGDVNQEELRKQVREQMRLGKPVKIALRPARPAARPKPAPARPAPPRELPVPKMTEEPKTEARRTDSRVVVDMRIPGVKSEKDIQIQELEESVEVKAMAGDKAYFKILTKPARTRLVKKSLKNGKLVLEFA